MRQIERPRGIIHVHTACSADGLLEPPEIARMCRDRGLAFAALTDHAEDMTERSMAELVRKCEEHSGEGFVLVPGLEHRFRNGVHLLALGQRTCTNGVVTLDSLEAPVDSGCVLIAAHCAADEELPARLLRILSAVEIWNVSRHTRFLPVTGCATAYQRWARTYPELYAIGGLDMHRGNEWGCEVVIDHPCEASSEAILAGIKAGEFSTRGRLVSFRSRPVHGVRDLAFAAGNVLAGVRDVRNRVMAKT